MGLVSGAAFFASGVRRLVKSSRINVNVRFRAAQKGSNVRLGATGWRARVGLGLRDFLTQVDQNCAINWCMLNENFAVKRESSPRISHEHVKTGSKACFEAVFGVFCRPESVYLCAVQEHGSAPGPSGVYQD